MSEQKAPQRVGDVVPPRTDLEGLQYHVRDLVGKEFTIEALSEWEGEKGPYLALAIRVRGEPGFLFTSHLAIFRKLLLCQDKLPLLATILTKTGKASGREYFDIE